MKLKRLFGCSFWTLATLTGILVFALLCGGCGSLVKSVSGKSVSLKGYGSVNLIDTGYDPTTGTVTPSVKNIVGSVHHKSTIVAIDEGKRTPDYLDYTREESSSVWNSNAKTVTTSFTVSGSSPESMKSTLETLKLHLNAGTSNAVSVPSE